MLKKEYVLVFPSWYPSRVNEFNGDFNERTIKALSSMYHQVVIYLVADKTIKKLEIQKNTDNQITTIIGYYPKSKFKLINLLSYLYHYFKITNHEIKKHGIPLYIHTYVFFPAGLISLYFSKKLKLKNVLTEHWTIFYKHSNDSIHHQFFLLKYFYKQILKRFNLILPVAKALENEIRFWVSKSNFLVIPNVVDTSIFNYDNIKKDDQFTFLHVSTMTFQKNPELLLSAFETYFQMNNQAKLKLVGPIRKEILLKVSSSSKLRNAVIFLGEISYKSVAEEMKKAHALVLTSRFENLPCVILEALCCGLPVVSSDVGGISEVINKNNGVLFDPNDVDKIVESFNKIVSNYSEFNLKLISKAAICQFSYHYIANDITQALKVNHIIHSTEKP